MIIGEGRIEFEYTPFDAHNHFRQGEAMAVLAPHTFREWWGGVAMPNTDPPQTVAELSTQHAREILTHLPGGQSFVVVSVLYLTSQTTSGHIKDAALAGVSAVKFYPKDMTTNSEFGLDNLLRSNALRAINDHGLVLCLHAEACGCEPLLAEQSFIPTLKQLLRRYPRMKIVIEHISSAQMVRFYMKMREKYPNLCVTVTPHHMVCANEDIAGRRCRPHNHCAPVPKFRSDRNAVAELGTSGDPNVAAGTDNAGHQIHKKESAEGPCGVFNAPVAIPTYTKVFEERNALNHLEHFLCVAGPTIYNLSPLRMRRVYRRLPWKVPMEVGAGEYRYRPFRAGEMVEWQYQPE